MRLPDRPDQMDTRRLESVRRPRWPHCPSGQLPIHCRCGCREGLGWENLRPAGTVSLPKRQLQHGVRRLRVRCVRAAPNTPLHSVQRGSIQDLQRNDRQEPGTCTSEHLSIALTTLPSGGAPRLRFPYATVAPQAPRQRSASALTRSGPWRLISARLAPRIVLAAIAFGWIGWSRAPGRVLDAA
jgi:hypothetical protein